MSFSINRKTVFWLQTIWQPCTAAASIEGVSDDVIAKVISGKKKSFLTQILLLESGVTATN